MSFVWRSCSVHVNNARACEWAGGRFGIWILIKFYCRHMASFLLEGRILWRSHKIVFFLKQHETYVYTIQVLNIYAIMRTEQSTIIKLQRRKRLPLISFWDSLILYLQTSVTKSYADVFVSKLDNKKWIWNDQKCTNAMTKMTDNTHAKTK